MLKIEETIKAMRLIKNNYWLDIISNTNDGEKFLNFAGNQFMITDGRQLIDGVEYYFTINDVLRDAAGNIVETGGTGDLNTKAINMTASWTDNLGIVATYNSKIYLTNWNTKVWKEYTESDFTSGTNNGSLVTDTNGGAVELDLEDTILADWCLPQLTTTYYDLPGNGAPEGITALPGVAFMGTGANASGKSFINIELTDADPPGIDYIGDLDGYKTNGVFGEEGYGYIATDTNSEEVVIIDLNTSPLTKVGWFDASGSSDGIAVETRGTVGYLIQGSTFRVFDLTSKSGSRSALGSYTMSGVGVDMVINGNYAYILINHTSYDLIILNITNPASISQVATANLDNGGAVKSIFVNEDGTLAIVGSLQSSSKKEVFIVNTTTKVGSLPIISSIELNGTGVRDVILVEEDQRLIAAGNSGQEYQVFNIENPAAPTYCGGLNFDEGITGMATVGFINTGNTYTYIITHDNNQEFAVIKGGPMGGGGGGGGGSQYIEYGEYISSIFDSGSTNTYYYLIQWDEQLFTNTDIQVQVRTGNTADLSGASWVGPDGTGSSYFTDGSGSYLPSIIQNKRYFQYRVELTSDKVETPILEEIHIEYQ